MRILIYTAITGNYDLLRFQPSFKEDVKAEVRFIAYLDNATPTLSTMDKAVARWHIRPAVDNFKDPKRNCQAHKVLSHLYTFDNDYSVWIDGSVILKAPITKLIKDNMTEGTDIALLRHSERDCAYQEAKDCVHFKLDNSEVINEQMNKYTQIGFPENFGLSETPVIIRRNTRDVMAFNSLWWSIITRYSKRDQLSFDFVRWSLAMPVNYIEGNIHDNKYFNIAKHEVLREHEK